MIKKGGLASFNVGEAACTFSTSMTLTLTVPIMPTTTSTPVPRPDVESLDAILPEEPLLMMGAGPVPITAAVARANTVVINHLGSTMVKVIGQVKTMARYVFQTNSKWVLGVAGPGSAAMEMAISNLAWQGTRVLSIKNGFFSARMAGMGRRVGAGGSRLGVG